MHQTVLLVEDEENDVFFMRRAWKHAGITAELHVAEDGQVAIHHLRQALPRTRQNFPFPCLVLLDLKLPRVMGFDVLKWIRHQPQLQAMFVVIFSSSHLNSDVETAHRLGANSYLVKPNAADKLLQTTRQINESWLGSNRPSL